MKPAAQHSSTAAKASDQNPLVAESPVDTLGNICAVVNFLQWVETGEFGAGPGDSASTGRHLIYRTVTAAAWSLEPHLRKDDAHV